MRNVVVTGGGTGIGAAVAAAFAAAGDQVVITGRRDARLKETATHIGGSVRCLTFDASDPAAVSQALVELPTTVHVLVNNAGGNTDFVQPESSDELVALAAAYRANFAANVLSAALMTAALGPRLADDGRIVTIGSIAARTGAGSYGAAKAAVEAWTASVAADFGPRGITANVVSPGYTGGTEFFRGRMTDERRTRLIAATATKRAGAPQDVAALVTFLASPAAGHITGQVVHVNGGAYLGR
jgi:3-oxoacyl-[acyl-carrier protein] reductase